MSAFVTSVASLVLKVILRHHVGELVLVVVLDTFFITILKDSPLVINIVSSVGSSEHLIQQHQIRH